MEENYKDRTEEYLKRMKPTESQISNTRGTFQSFLDHYYSYYCSVISCLFGISSRIDSWHGILNRHTLYVKKY